MSSKRRRNHHAIGARSCRTNIASALRRVLHDSFARLVPRPDRDVTRTPVAVCRHTSVPAVAKIVRTGGRLTAFRVV